MPQCDTPLVTYQLTTLLPLPTGVGQGLRSRVLSNVKTCQKVCTDEIIQRNHKADNLQVKNWKIPAKKGESSQQQKSPS